jgi:hypothetical protein
MNALKCPYFAIRGDSSHSRRGLAIPLQGENDLILREVQKMPNGISPLLCTVCSEPLEENAAGIFGIECGGSFTFGWTCCHRLVGDVAILLGSFSCTEIWLEEHPEYRKIIFQLIEEHERAKKNEN